MRRTNWKMSPRLFRHPVEQFPHPGALHDTLAEIQRAIKDTQALRNLSGACEHLDALNRRLVHQLCRPPAVIGRFRLEPEKMGKGFTESCAEMNELWRV